MIIPATKYTAQAVDGYLNRTKDGKERIVVKFAIVGGQYDGQAVDWAGFFTDKTFDRTIQSLRYCGWRGDDISDLTGIDANEVQIVVQHDEYNEKVYPRVAWVNQIGGGARMPADEVREFAESIKARIGALSSAEPEPEETTPF